MKSVQLAIALGLTTLTAACGQKAESPPSPEANQSSAMNESAASMGNMAMPTEAKTAKGSGTVTAIDKAAGKITLEHQAIPEAGWPAMTMAFDAKPAVIDGVTVGDKVTFDLALKDGGGEVTTISKQ
ncbi:Cu/Ag efflux protein CusF [Hephaestia caeni]|uniref:Cu/Ag efflux protein CusF n=1 Tax=Hephaestia caeni TaxID=645617 RepID=A0A397NIJ3_9SPHN|nr:copper-binding protein [Hephaestia caeni]RIA37356.1 Cu/Ag efflux protein CusF [Hephaestia caeni]